MSAPIITDRSRIETFEQCSRKRWWLYEYDAGGAVRGLERDAFSTDLFYGQCAHVGLESLMVGFKHNHHTPEQLEASVAIALGMWDRGLAERSAASLSQMGAAAMRVLLESHIRGWERVHAVTMTSIYEVLEVEREESCPVESRGASLRLLARLDGLVRRRTDGALFVWSFKTASQCDSRWEDSLRYDNQSVSEVLAAEHRLGVRCDGVIVSGLVKGQKRTRVGDDWVTSSPLVWRYVGPGGVLSADYQRGKGWEKQMVTSPAVWIDFLSDTAPATLAEQFPVLPAILRSEHERERWKRTAVAQEATIRAHREDVESLPAREQAEALDVLFPMQTAHGNCTGQYGKRCPCFELCHGGAAEAPLESGYRVRTPNHIAELEVKL